MRAMLGHHRRTYHHMRRVGQYAALIADGMGLPRTQVRLARAIGRYHDLGKLDLPRTILDNRGPLSEKQWAQVRCHPDHGRRRLRAALGPGHPLAQKLIAGVLQHHERLDGSGYPRQTRHINRCARIAAVADAFDAMTSQRSYNRRLSSSHALEILKSKRGTHFDHAVVAALEGILRARQFRVLSTGRVLGR
jgi:HD-GYP domain-containing protein (c-di-GMP phosphodiesterase class II)